jgi:hypothetical protein
LSTARHLPSPFTLQSRTIPSVDEETSKSGWLGTAHKHTIAESSLPAQDSCIMTRVCATLTILMSPLAPPTATSASTTTSPPPPSPASTVVREQGSSASQHRASNACCGVVSSISQTYCQRLNYIARSRRGVVVQLWCLQSVCIYSVFDLAQHQCKVRRLLTPPLLYFVVSFTKWHVRSRWLP